MVDWLIDRLIASFDKSSISGVLHEACVEHHAPQDASIVFELQ